MWINMKPYTKKLYDAVATHYLIGITDKKASIDQKRDAITLKPGNQFFIQVLPRIVSTSTDHDELDVKERNCRLSHETEGFLFLQEYSRKGCEFECAAQKAVQICKCLPWFYPNDFTIWPMCEMFGGYCFDTIMEDERYYQKCRAECLTDCKETEFVLVYNSVPIDLDSACKYGSFHHRNFERNFMKHFAFHNYKTLVEGGSIPNLMESLANNSLCKDYVQNYVAFVSVESGETRIIVTERVRRIFFYDQVGTFGGALGLCVGMSVIGMFEVAFLIFNIIAQFGNVFNAATKIDDIGHIERSHNGKIHDRYKLLKLETYIQVRLHI